jgi:hypothetical protein
MHDNEQEKHFKNALSNYVGVLDILARFDNDGIVHNSEAQLPLNCEQENLLLLGEYLAVVNLTENEKKVYRESTSDLISRNGVQWVWQNRRKLAAEIIFIRHF